MIVSHAEVMGTAALLFICLVLATWAAYMIGLRVGRDQADDAEVSFDDLREAGPDLDTIPLAAVQRPIGQLVRGYGTGLPAPVAVSSVTGRTTDIIARWDAETEAFIAGLRA